MEIIPTLTDLISEACIGYKEHFEDGVPSIKAYAPGRVNIIGEHTDYNDGFVMPMAIPLYTVVVGKASNRETCQVVTLNPEFSSHNSVEFPAKLNPSKREELGPKWSHYVMGVVAQFKSVTCAFNAVILSSVPVGSGLSSSAALEVAMYTFLQQLNPDIKMNDRDKAIACQEAEYVYANVPCGIMDQFISVMGRDLHALFLDCRDMNTELVCLRNPAVKVFITNSNFRHELVSGEYAARRSQCEKAAEIMGVASLRDASLDLLKEKQSEMDDVTFRRARHVITENARVIEVLEALKISDYPVAGRALIASHASLKDDFEVSCPEIDELVNLAVSTEGVYGSRITGGGFGGCTITLVKDSAVDRLIAKLKTSNLKPTFYVCNPCAGCGVIP